MQSADAAAGDIASRILVLRGHKALIDTDLASLYGVSTKRLNEQVKRNRARFPADFVFQLTASERAEVVAKCGHLSRLKYSPTLPFAFTEHGALMAASVLNSESKYDGQFRVVFDAIRELVRPPHPAPRRRIGFVQDT